MTMRGRNDEFLPFFTSKRIFIFRSFLNISIDLRCLALFLKIGQNVFLIIIF